MKPCNYSHAAHAPEQVWEQKPFIGTIGMGELCKSSFTFSLLCKASIYICFLFKEVCMKPCSYSHVSVPDPTNPSTGRWINNETTIVVHIIAYRYNYLSIHKLYK